MQIYGPGQVHATQSINAPHRTAEAQPSAAPAASAAGSDQVEISHEAELLSQLREIPDIRADRVAEIRLAIEAGSYETEEKLDIALDRLLQEIGG